MMTTRIARGVLMGLGLAISTAGSAVAQVFTPSFLAPRSSSDIGVYLSDGPGAFALEGIWRRAAGSYDLGLRVGVADTDDASLLVGGEIRNPISTGAPLDLAVSGTAQALLGDVSGAGFLVGLILGGTFGDSQLTFTPYIHPRAGLVEFVGDGFDLELVADAGLDIRVGSDLEVRFGFAIDDLPGDWGVGVAWR
ncbi:MAG: hypothetical protein WD766_11575 [Gemmatimonadota bacterium]